MALFGYKFPNRSILNVGFFAGFLSGILVTLIFQYSLRTTSRVVVTTGVISPVVTSARLGDPSGGLTGYEKDLVTLRPPVRGNEYNKIEDEDKHVHDPSENIKNHEDVEKLVEDNRDKPTHDHDHHQDNTVLAEALVKSVRILCWVMTSPANHKSRAKHIQATWGKRCDKLLFVSEQDDGSLPILEVRVEGGREHLTAKTMKAFDHIYQDHLHEADWFMKADDDTFVIIENLRYFLSGQNSSMPIFFGHHFKVIVAQGYFSGGGGYVLSKEALTRFGKRGPRTCRDDSGAEDVEMGRCMERLGVAAGDSRDALGRSRFHCFNPETHLMGGYPDWYLSYDKYGARYGMENISDYAITFHYVDVNQLYGLEYYVYHLRPYGLISGPANLNRNNSVDTSSS